MTAINEYTTVNMPVSTFKDRKSGEYTGIIRPLKNPASPISDDGIAKKYII
jgi:hypothetical protein